MVKGLSYYLRQAWKKPSKEATKTRLIEWRAGNAITKVEKPLRIDRARCLGYKAKRGIIVIRVRLMRGGRKRSMQKKGRVSRKQTIRKTLKMSYQWVAEMRVARRYPSLEVLNSYNIGKDGNYFYYEVILIDPNAPEIKSDPILNWICSNKNRKRVERGLTSAARKSRGLTGRHGKSPELKVRPSLRAWSRLGK